MLITLSQRPVNKHLNTLPYAFSRKDVESHLGQYRWWLHGEWKQARKTCMCLACHFFSGGLSIHLYSFPWETCTWICRKFAEFFRTVFLVNDTFIMQSKTSTGSFLYSRINTHKKKLMWWCVGNFKYAKI